MDIKDSENFYFKDTKRGNLLNELIDFQDTNLGRFSNVRKSDASKSRASQGKVVQSL